jgi:DNA-binding FrmR family transcriptional regulator
MDINNNGIKTDIEGGCPNCRRKKREDEEYRALANRLSRIEGQIRGLRRMLDEDAYCIDIITQASAVSSALSSFNRELLSSHIKTCVAEDIKRGGGESVDELLETLTKLLK